MNDLVGPGRFNGPARSGNGGFVAGSLAERVSTTDAVLVIPRVVHPVYGGSTLRHRTCPVASSTA